MKIVGNHWHCSIRTAERIEKELDTLEGFVYLWRNLVTGEYYFGRKGFWTKRTSTRTTAKGSKVKRRYAVESDWRSYCSSSAEVLESTAILGGHEQIFRILAVFCGKAGVSTAEAALILSTGGFLPGSKCLNRSAPALRGYIRLKPEDQEEIRLLLKWINHFNLKNLL